MLEPKLLFLWKSPTQKSSLWVPARFWESDFYFEIWAHFRHVKENNRKSFSLSECGSPVSLFDREDDTDFQPHIRTLAQSWLLWFLLRRYSRVFRSCVWITHTLITQRFWAKELYSSFIIEVPEELADRSASKTSQGALKPTHFPRLLGWWLNCFLIAITSSWKFIAWKTLERRVGERFMKPQ